MKVSSPIGDLPFEPRRIQIRKDGIRVDGVMGAWPATVEITAQDIPALGRVLARPAATAAVVTVAALTLARTVRAGNRIR